MPAVMKCPTCGFQGNHGFTDTVAGIVRFYHSTPDPQQEGQVQGNCYSFHADDQWFTTLEDAWKHVRPRLVREQTARDGKPDTNWLGAWDARILDHDERKAKKLFKAWENSWR